jgi:hypothetical protein
MENITDETTSYPALFSVLALCEYYSCRPWRYPFNFSNAGHHQVNYLDKNYSFLISTLSVKFLVAGASVLFIYFIAKLGTTGRREQGLPPGPPVTPVVGNALQFPTGFPHIWCARVHPITVYSISRRCSLLWMPQIHRMGTYVWPNRFRQLHTSLLNNLIGF